MSEVIPPVGLSIIVNPEDPSLDVVFVHGFTGHPERTWTYKKGDARHLNQNDSSYESGEPPSKVPKLNPFSRPRHTIYWPRDLLPTTIPNARILTYGYDTNIKHFAHSPISRSTVYDIGSDFLVSLEAERRLEPLRPVLFIAHSLGGIIVKEMLRRAGRSQEYLHNIFHSTIGIMFFGTPHGGADPLGFSQGIIENLAKAIGFRINKQVVDTLMPSSERLMELRDEFGPMAQEEKWLIHSFQEQLGVSALGGNKVVEDTSSCLHLPYIETRQHIERDHMDMCRFAGFHDMEYKKVSAALCRMINTISQKPSRDTLILSEEEKLSRLESLRFDQIHSRHMTIKKAYGKTCNWLLERSEYVDWLDIKQHEYHCLLWIKGNPGTGKSTLMKFALFYGQKSKSMHNRIILSFFFNARGEDLEKSTIGMYRSLLLQLLEQVPELQCVLHQPIWGTEGYHQWSIELLEELFEQAIQGLGQESIVCFIDALDECAEREIRRMISFFERIGDLADSIKIRFHVCFSSRHYPHITTTKGLSLVLEDQEGHGRDISNYLDRELKIGHSKIAEEIRSELREKASGVFMWVVLVVDILNREYDGGRIHKLRQRLRDIPGDLHRLFQDILTRDSLNRDQLVLCVQWVLFARRPLTPEQFYFAILSGVEPEELSTCHSDETTLDDIKRFILHSSKGLAEITKSKTPTVQFIHESVVDFFLKENGVSILWDDLGNNFRGQSHKRLTQCCLNYMSIDTTTHLDLSNPLPKASSQDAATLRQSATKWFPFLEYAVRHVLYHADATEGDVAAQQEFIHEFQLAKWIIFDNLFEKHQLRRHTSEASLLYILAENNMSNLIRLHPRNLLYLDDESERYGVPLFAALAAGSYEAFETFLKVELDNQTKSSSLDTLYNRLCQGRNSWASFKRDFRFIRGRSIFSILRDYKYETLLLFLLESGRIDARSKDNSGQTPLSWASQNGSKEVVKLLLETGRADVESKDYFGRTPLSCAAGGGSMEVVKLLLETGRADVESKDDFGRTPLSYAAEGRSKEVVKLLLDTGRADVESKDNFGRTPLSYAAGDRSKEVVKLLLETGKFDVKSKDNSDQTPLSLAAAVSGSKAVFKLLQSISK